MFGKNKSVELIERLEEKLEARLASLEQRIADGNAGQAEMNRNLDRLQKAVREQGMSVEDLLEEWSGRKSDEDDVKERFRECARDEQRLLELFEAYQEQFKSLKRFVDGKDESWSVQIGMMEKNLERCRQMCGISLIGECGDEVDYDLHEVIEAVDTKQADLDRKVADVYRCGYMYKGKVRRKAQVAAYSAGNSGGNSDG